MANYHKKGKLSLRRIKAKLANGVMMWKGNNNRRRPTITFPLPKLLGMMILPEIVAYK